MPSARKLLTLFLLGQTACAAAIPSLDARADANDLAVRSSPFDDKSLASLLARAAPIGRPGGNGKPNDPTDPTSEEPTDPGSNEPTLPSGEQPNDPQSDPNAPTPPGSEDPTDPNVPVCRRAGGSCGGGDAPTTLAGKLGVRKAGDGIADATPKSLGDSGYTGDPTPPASPNTPAVDGGLDPVKDAAPEGSSLHSMTLQGYSKTLVRGANAQPDDAPLLNMQTDAKTDMHAIVEAKDKTDDRTPDGSKQPFSEVIGQSLDKAFDGNFGGKLQKVTQYHVANTESEALLADLWGKLTHNGNMADVPRDLTTDSAWSQLAQTPNGGALFRYSDDHFDRLQGWQPVRAEVYRQTFDFAPDLVFWHLTWVYGNAP